MPNALPSTAIRSPEELLRLDAEKADELLDLLEAAVPLSPELARISAGEGRATATVFGDSHGDWRSTMAAANRFLERPAERALIGLGDYVDRAPPDCGEGSVANALYLLQLVAAYPSRVTLLTGNHETTTRIPAIPHDLPEEVDRLWGPDERRYLRIVHLLSRGPIAALTSSGAYLAHGGFPRGPIDGALEAAFRSPSEERLLEIVWGESDRSRSHRGVVRPFDEAELTGFLSMSGSSLFLRGHDPELVGRPLYEGRCLTLHTSRRYERFGGVIVAELPLDRPVRGVSDVAIEHLPTEGRLFEEPP